MRSGGAARNHRCNCGESLQLRSHLVEPHEDDGEAVADADHDQPGLGGADPVELVDRVHWLGAQEEPAQKSGAQSGG